MTVHWITNFDSNGFHRAECGVKVSISEVENQKFEGVFRFKSQILSSMQNKKGNIPEHFCKQCAEIAVRQLKKNKQL